MVLYLTEHARVQSTFGGHYDLAAFLVIVLNLAVALAFKQKNKLLKALYHGVHLLGLWLLVMTASRTSFLAYLFGALIIIFLIAKEKSKIKEQLKWGLSRTILLVAITSIMMFSFGDDMSERFLHVLQGYPQVTIAYNSINDYRKQAGKFVLVAVGLKERDIQPPQDGIGVSDLDQVLTPSDQRPTGQKPADVYVDVPITVSTATQSADGTTYIVNIQQDRTWSNNALKYGLSTAIRLDALWPNAIKGFLSNPLLGSGYATLNKETAYHFTEAESTDNNFLRTLGETGLLGFISFYGVVSLAIYLAFKLYRIKKDYVSAISVGFIGASLGLLLNATYIDVFAASKVAFTYWALTGVVMALFYLENNQWQCKCPRLTKWVKNLKKRFNHEN
jgi:O-antigen ligase